MSTVSQCGSGAAVPEYLVCQKLAALPSIALVAGSFSAVGSSLAAGGVQDARGSVTSGVPCRLISAAVLHGPRLPASVRAVSRMYRAVTAGNGTLFSVWSSAKVPVATALPQVTPSLETKIWYWPMLPLR